MEFVGMDSGAIICSSGHTNEARLNFQTFVEAQSAHRNFVGVIEAFTYS